MVNTREAIKFIIIQQRDPDHVCHNFIVMEIIYAKIFDITQLCISTYGGKYYYILIP